MRPVVPMSMARKLARQVVCDKVFRLPSVLAHERLGFTLNVSTAREVTIELFEPQVEEVFMAEEIMLCSI